MGRRKITISQIVDPKLRHITFNKRKNGLIKKAAELALLCNVNMLLCFEDDQGNLIQFSKNKLANIPSFFNECRYNNVLEFVARDYPNFFKVNHYKKYRTQNQNGDYDQDDMDFCEEDDLESMNPGPSSEKSSNKRQRPQAHSRPSEEDLDSSKMVYQSDEESDTDATDNLISYENSQFAPRKQVHVDIMKPKISIPPEKPKEIISDQQGNEPVFEEREVSLNKKESFQSYNGKELQHRGRMDRKVDIAAQFAGFDHAFKRNSQIGNNQNSSLRYYGNQVGEEMNMREPNPVQNNFNNSNYKQTYQFYQNQGYLNGPSTYTVGPKATKVVYTDIPNEEPYMMIKVPIGIQGPASYIAKNVHRPNMEENMYETANMIKILNGTTTNNNAYTNQQKVYNYHPMEMGKVEEIEATSQMKGRPDFDGYSANYEQQEYMESANYIRNDYRYDTNNQSNLPSNLPSAYFSSKKFNFEGNMSMFEDDRVSELGDSRKKYKQV